MPAEILVAESKEALHAYVSGRSRSLVRGGITVLPHVQAFADALTDEVGPLSIGTYAGHQPTPPRALDIFHAIGDHATADRICAFYTEHWREFGGDYIISRRKIWNPEISGAWRPMENRGGATQNHEDHAHTSYEPTGSARPGPSTPPPPAPPKEDEVFSKAPYEPCGYLVSRSNEQVVDIQGDVRNGADVGLWPADGQKDQRWLIANAGDGTLSFVSLGGNQALDSPGGNEVWVWEHDPANANQRWKLERIDYGLFVLEHAGRDGMVLTADGGSLSIQPPRKKGNTWAAEQVFDFTKTI